MTRTASTALAQLHSGKRLTVTVTVTLSPTAGGKPLSSAAKVSDRLPTGTTRTSPGPLARQSSASAQRIRTGSL
jgi:hypothetical protein